MCIHNGSGDPGAASSESFCFDYALAEAAILLFSFSLSVRIHRRFLTRGFRASRLLSFCIAFPRFSPVRIRVAQDVPKLSDCGRLIKAARKLIALSRLRRRSALPLEPGSSSPAERLLPGRQ